MEATLTLYIKKISDQHHEFRYVRSDGSGETLTLDSKTFLLHDLIHFAVESRAGLADSFYGLLVSGETYDSLNEKHSIKDGFGGELGMTERIVGGLTPVMKGNATPEQFLAAARNLIEAYNRKLPMWLDQGFIADVQEHIRRIVGEWNSIAYGDTLILHFYI